jgi:diguanylate cyclase (GGDEF)-like protein
MIGNAGAPVPDEIFPSMADLQDLGTEAVLAQGDVLWREGDPGDHAVVLLEGSLEVTHETPEGETLVLRNMYAGAVVGEVAVLDGQARSATVSARTRCKILKVPASRFREFLRQRPDIMEQLFWLQLERVRSLTWRVTRTHHRAITDTLTGLYNFGFFRERLDIELERALLTNDPVSLVMFDIDHFKVYNDTYGHPDGDVVLRTVADILRSTARRVDVVARYGGEEFVALLYGASRSEAARFAESCRVAIEGYPFAGRESQPLGRVTLSGGVASFPNDAADDMALIRAADLNLYKAKQAGRNQIVPPPGVPS